MSRFAELFGGLGVSTLREHLGEAVTLKGTERDDLTVTAISVSAIRGEEADAEFGREARRSRTVSLKRTAIDPAEDWKTVVIGTEEWSIEWPPESEDDNVVVFNLVSAAPLALSRPGFRGGS